MQYPLISEYVQAILDAESSLDKLTFLKPVLDNHGEPYRSSGAFAVVFKMIDEKTGKYYALKCFTEEQLDRCECYRMISDELSLVKSPFMTNIQFFEKEIFVDSNCTDETEFPVLLMDWIEGETMEYYITAHYKDADLMKILLHQFCLLAAWLLKQPFAHGDIKPDNIMVRPDKSLALIDYDGMYVPEMKGRKSPTLGTRDYTHPLRSINDFDKTIDDFSLASISLSLKVISLDSTYLDKFGAPDRLLFANEDYRMPNKSEILQAITLLLYDSDLCRFYGNFLVVLSSKSIPYQKEKDEEYIGLRNEDNEKSGFGTLKKIDGSIYSGEWKLDMRSGFGLAIDRSRVKYAGQWRSNVKNGIGIQLQKDGTIYSGEWNNGKYHGIGTLFYPNGEKLYTHFDKGDLKNNFGIWTLKDGTLVEGNMTTKGPSGKCKHRLNDGRIVYEIWKEGKLIN